MANCRQIYVLIQNNIFKKSQKLSLSSIIRSVSQSVSQSVCPKPVFYLQRSLRRNSSPPQSMQSQLIKVKVLWEYLPTQSTDNSCIIQFYHRIINSINAKCDLPGAWTIFNLYIQIRREGYNISSPFNSMIKRSPVDRF